MVGGLRGEPVDGSIDQGDGGATGEWSGADCGGE